LRRPKKGKKAAKNSNNNIAATIFITLLTPLLTFFIVLKYIDDNPATKPKSLWEVILVLLMAIVAAAAVSAIGMMIYIKFLKTIKTWPIFFILILFLSMAASLTSAWYILEKPSFGDLVRPLIPFLSKLPPSEAVPPNPSVSGKAVTEPGKNSAETGQSSDIKKEKSQKGDEPGEKSEPQSRTKPEMKDQTGSKESSSVPGKVPGTVTDQSDSRMNFVYIKPGIFMMGSPKDEPERNEVERQHRVAFIQGFYMQATEVTQKQWKAVMGDNPSHFKECGNCPVETVSWDDVQEFIKRLNDIEKTDSYRLPTEAEWEYAARAGSETAYCFGNDAADLGKYAWYSENSEGKTHPVAQKEPNAWSLYDMHGNVWEWCQDWYDDYPFVYSILMGDILMDPTGPDTGSYRVRRGGSSFFSASYCRSAYRISLPPPGNRDRGLGFRLVREAP